MKSSKKIAIVGLGTTGGRIAGRMTNNNLDIYIISDTDWFKEFFQGYQFYTFNELNKLEKALIRYEKTIFVAELGGTSGDVLFKLQNKFKNSTTFVIKPFRAKKEKFEKSEIQIKQINYHLVRDLNDLLHKMPDKPIGKAIDVFDNKVVEEIKRIVESEK